MDHIYDVAVIGGGPGGYIAAIRCAQYGNKVALIEKDEIGGTCLNRGCIPTKVLANCAETAFGLLSKSKPIIKADNIEIDYDGIAFKRDNTISKLRNSVRYLLKKNKIDLYKGTGSLEDHHTISIGAEEITARYIIIAAGSVVGKPNIKGISNRNVITSSDILQYSTFPDNIIIIGGGIIGIEFANILCSFGKNVTLIEIMSDILSGLDEELRIGIRKILDKKGVKIITNAEVCELFGDSNISCRYKIDNEEYIVSAEKCLLASGRVPDTKQFMEHGFVMKNHAIVVDNCMKTNIDNIYAIGDIIGKAQLAHVASAHGFTAAASINDKQSTIDHSVIPNCIYISPECASVGITQEEAEQKYQNIEFGSFPVSANAKSIIEGYNNGFCKIIINKDNGKILGAHILAPHATDMITEISAVMKFNGTIGDLASIIHPHPTVSEIIFEAANDTIGLSCHK